jgi:hypothetical protein
VIHLGADRIQMVAKTADLTVSDLDLLLWFRPKLVNALVQPHRMFQTNEGIKNLIPQVSVLARMHRKTPSTIRSENGGCSALASLTAIMTQSFLSERCPINAFDRQPFTDSFIGSSAEA